jgi:hypothetical protein
MTPDHNKVPDLNRWELVNMRMKEAIAPLGRALRVFRADKVYGVSSYHVGIDFGQSQDFTALCVLREEWATKSANSVDGGVWREVEYALDDRRLEVVHLARLPLGTSYVDQAAEIINLAKRTGEATRGEGSVHEDHIPALYLVADASGVGRGPIDLIRKVGWKVRAVTITAGGQTTYHTEDNDWHVPKRDLVVATQIAMQAGRLKIAKGIPDSEALKRELLAFKYRLTSAAHDVYGVDWREGGEHDDLVLALCVSVFSTNLAAGWRQAERDRLELRRVMDTYQYELGG